jgi:cell shape-determining protein MreC
MEGFPCLLIEGHVVQSDGNPMRDRRLMDVGENHGVRPGDIVTTRRIATPYANALPTGLAVLGTNYLVGVVTDSAAYSATLQLVTDRQFRMPATLYRMLSPGQQRDIFVQTPGGGLEKKTVAHDGKTTGAYPVGEPIPVVAEGGGKQILLQHVPASHNIQPGDLLATGEATAQLLPFGLTIGRVVDSKNESKEAHMVTVFVEPLADLSRVENVYVVMPPSRSVK